MLILGLHIRDSRNAGDRYSSPLDYFAFPGHEVVVGDMRSPPNVRPDVVIYGGGSITASPDFRRWPGALTIAWGVGHHVRNAPWADAMLDEHARAAPLCDLYFTRDVNVGWPMVPDVSCMHSVFDEVSEPQHEIVRYSAARRVDASGDGPHMSNEDGDIVAAVRFLASGQKVVTSSYHGAYWAGLLGRQVEIVPWGSKFFYLSNMDLARSRAANLRAYEQVCGTLNG